MGNSKTNGEIAVQWAIYTIFYQTSKTTVDQKWCLVNSDIEPLFSGKGKFPKKKCPNWGKFATDYVKRMRQADFVE